MWQLATMHVHTAILSTTMQGRYGLIRVQQLCRIKGCFNPKECVPLFFIKLYTHGIDLFDPHTMLTRDGAAQRNAGFENFIAEVFCTVPLVFIRTIKQNQRMQIAVAGVEDVGDAEAVFLPPLAQCQHGGACLPAGRTPSLMRVAPPLASLTAEGQSSPVVA